MSDSEKYNKFACVGRFAPSPTGRMHLGNVYTALISYISIRQQGGKWILRIEDLDPKRSKYEYARLLEDDLHWLGLDWDEGGIDDAGPSAPYSQSRRGSIYEHYYNSLVDRGITYPCRCRRADILATQAPHQSDGRVVYTGTCRPAKMPCYNAPITTQQQCATRLYVPPGEIKFTDMVFGKNIANIAEMCGDFVIRRADGAWAYQLAVVVDDALMGVTEVVRGCDLLLSTAQQIYLYCLLGFDQPRFAHLPLMCNAMGQRLSKRDSSMSMEELRKTHTPEELLGRIASIAGIIKNPRPCTLSELVELFSWSLLTPATQLKI